MTKHQYVTRVFGSMQQIDATTWDGLLHQQAQHSPFFSHAYLSALHNTRCASHATGWALQVVTIWASGMLVGICPIYLKSHSRGEYVFDHAWAHAYHANGIAYYPKAIIASPFTPVPGAKLLAVDANARAILAQAVWQFCLAEGVSSLHLLFATPNDDDAFKALGGLSRQTVQFHWTNSNSNSNYFIDFDEFLSHLNMEKRKKIKQERRKIVNAGVIFVVKQGTEIAPSDWDFFYSCYCTTYIEHGNAPYLNREFFSEMANTMPDNWLLFVAKDAKGQPIASSLLAIDRMQKVAYGRYWGALLRVDCLHFEACYYQPIAWCIANGYLRFEGGAQGEHKMARALLPVVATSVHLLAHPAFHNAVADFLNRESKGMTEYMSDLMERIPIKNHNQSLQNP